MSRYNDIINILVKHGFNYFADALKIRYNAATPFLTMKIDEKLTEPVRLRQAFEELGPTFIKLAQVLSTRPDILPKDYIDELSKLQNTVAPAPYSEMEPIILKNLKANAIQEKLKEFNPECIASASIGQVYRAVLFDGSRVVIKVKRPNIHEIIEEDLKILRELARLIETNISEAKIYQPIDLVNEFSYAIREELDYLMEGQNADRVRKNFEKEESIHIPKIYWELTTKDMIVMEEISGIKINDTAALNSKNYNRTNIVKNSTRLVLKSILIDGFFHADPHPGNIFVMDKEILGVIDFGMMGRLAASDKRGFISLMQAYVNRDAEDLVEQMIMLSPAEESRYLDKQAFTRDLERVMSRYYDLSIQQVSFSNIINDSLDIIHKYHLKLPARYFLLLKTMIIIDGVSRELDSNFNLLDEVKPFLQEQFTFSTIFPEFKQEFWKNLLAFNDLAKDFPKAVRDILRQLKEGEFRLDIKHDGLKEAINELDAVANRISLAMIIASLIVGISLLLQVYKPIHQVDMIFSWVLSVLIVLTVVMLLWLLYDLFIKSRKW